jgi:hypothetical protein
MTQPKRKRGRPAFKPTAVMRRTVERMMACGDSKDTISRAIGCSIPTLEQHFENELKDGYAKKRQEVLNMMFDGARKGNAALIKRLEEMTRAAVPYDQPAAPTDKPNETAAAPQGGKPKGKKEQQRAAALAAGTNSEWGDDLAPLPGTRPN